MTTEGFPGARGIRCGSGGPRAERGMYAPRAARGARRRTLSGRRGTRPLPRAYIGPCPSRSGIGCRGRERMPTEHTAKAAEGSQNQQESTLTLPSDCPTK